MSYETRPLDNEPVLAREALRIQKLTEPESPVNVLGNMVLGAVIGGALGSPSLMPRTEAITLELIAGTVEIADDIHYPERMAA